MLRLPAFELLQPTSLPEAVRLLAEAGPEARVLAGGTDLLPNMKHELLTPRRLVSLARIPELRGLAVADDGSLVIGAMTPLAEIAREPLVAVRAPALAQAAGLVAGPQLRERGTLGGNLLLDTRCQYYNQSHFWRAALGFCLKKDGAACHVVEGGSRCVAAASADTQPVLMTLGASVVLEGPQGSRTLPVDALLGSDGARPHRIAPGEVLALVRIPSVPAGHRGAYGKLRERGAIDFPLLGVAARLDVGEAGVIEHADLVLTALAARPRRVGSVAGLLRGRLATGPGFEAAVEAVAEAAARQCRALPNVPGDHEWRSEMVPVYVRRTLRAAAQGQGPVHHV
jgi:4-hydroxybenzoyl-CoA reductase subunit beta